MDHPFSTQRPRIEQIRASLAGVDDVRALLKANAKQRHLVATRKEASIEDAPLREAVTRQSARLGMLLADTDAALGTGLARDHQAYWDRLVTGGDTDAAKTKALQAKLDAAAKLGGGELARLGREEGEDDGSSSYSDYSDSTSVSSSDDDDDESEGEEDD